MNTAYLSGLRWCHALLIISLFLLSGCDRTRLSKPPIFDLYALPDYVAPAAEQDWSGQQLKQELAWAKQQLKQAESTVKKQAQLISTLRKPTLRFTPNKSPVDIEWEQAEAALKNRRYAEAKQRLSRFARQHSSHVECASAYYFLGQIMLLEGKPNDALSYFTTFVNQYPRDKRMPEARFNIGLAHYAKGDNQRAYRLFNQIQREYPTRQIGQQAKQQCQQLEKSGVNG